MGILCNECQIHVRCQRRVQQHGSENGEAWENIREGMVKVLAKSTGGEKSFVEQVWATCCDDENTLRMLRPIILRVDVVFLTGFDSEHDHDHLHGTSQNKNGRVNRYHWRTRYKESQHEASWRPCVRWSLVHLSISEEARGSRYRA